MAVSSSVVLGTLTPLSAARSLLLTVSELISSIVSPVVVVRFECAANVLWMTEDVINCVRPIVSVVQTDMDRIMHL